MRKAVCLILLLLSACSSPGGSYPSLRPRASESIDPRVPVVRPMNSRPASASLTDRLATLVALAETGDAAFEGPATEAERLAGSAGSPQSESWIAAQEALTAAIAARKPTTQALGDIDEIAATALQTQRGIAPKDLEAIQHAAAKVGAIDKKQAERLHAVQRQLGL